MKLAEKKDGLFFVKCQRCGDRINADITSIEMHSRTCLAVKCKDCGQMVGASIDAIEEHSRACLRLRRRPGWFNAWSRRQNSLHQPVPSAGPSDDDSDPLLFPNIAAVVAQGIFCESNRMCSMPASLASSSTTKTVVIDIGGGVCKAGFASDERPFASFPSVVGTPRRHFLKGILKHVRDERLHLGEDAVDARSELLLTRPIERGIITDWEAIAKIWHHTFYNQLRVEPENCNALLTEAPLNSKDNREKVASMMFEQLGVKGIYIAIQAVLSLYASSRCTGLFLDLGDGVTHAVPIFETYPIPHAITRINFAGRDLTLHLSHLLSERGFSLTSPSELESVRIVKESVCYVTLNYEEALGESEKRDKRRKTSGETSDKEIRFTLCGDEDITMGSERFRCPEALFQPVLAGKDCAGVHELVHKSIQNCDMSTRRDLYAGIVLSGGSTMFPSFEQRLAEEVKSLCLPAIKPIVHVLAPQDRMNSVWRGGSIMASSDEFQNSWIMKQEYMDKGSSIINRCSRMVSTTVNEA
mmetsp:Transcript_4250/g.6926  ORF Transcript_4250/g.6926 Transcript_4250/m.6926 type:complete len:527 (+) Transcript_4250:112-1692(+)